MSLARRRGNGQLTRCHAPPVQGAPSVADLTSVTFWSKKSAKASAEKPLAGREAPSPFLPSPSLIRICLCLPLNPVSQTLYVSQVPVCVSKSNTPLCYHKSKNKILT